MKVTELHSVEQMQELAARWDELAQTSGARASMHPFWCLAWWEAREWGRPLVVAVEDEGALVGVGPFHLVRTAGLEVVRFLGHGEFAASALVLAPGPSRAEVARAIWQTVLSAPRRVLHLQAFELGGPGMAELRSDEAFRVNAVLGDPCSVADLGTSFEDYWDSRPKDLRRAVGKAERRLQASSGASFRVELVTDSEGVDRVLPELRSIIDAAEGARPRQHELEGPAGQLTRRLLYRAAEAGRLRLFVGRVGAQPVSYQVSFTGGAGLSLEMTRFDPAWARFSPGHLLFREVVRAAVAESLPEVDFQMGRHAYKALWCNRSYELTELTGGARTAAVLAQHVAFAPLRVKEAVYRAASPQDRVRLSSASRAVRSRPRLRQLPAPRAGASRPELPSSVVEPQVKVG